MTAQLKPAPPRTMSQFSGLNGQFEGSGRAVHSVALQPWIDSMQVPGPACHTPSGSFDPAVFQPVRAAVTCRRCLRSLNASAATAPVDDPNQFVLALEHKARQVNHG